MSNKICFQIFSCNRKSNQVVLWDGIVYYPYDCSVIEIEVKSAYCFENHIVSVGGWWWLGNIYIKTSTRTYRQALK